MSDKSSKTKSGVQAMDVESGPHKHGRLVCGCSCEEHSAVDCCGCKCPEHGEQVPPKWVGKSGTRLAYVIDKPTKEPWMERRPVDISDEAMLAMLGAEWGVARIANKTLVVLTVEPRPDAVPVTVTSSGQRLYGPILILGGYDADGNPTDATDEDRMNAASTMMPVDLITGNDLMQALLKLLGGAGKSSGGDGPMVADLPGGGKAFAVPVPAEMLDKLLRATLGTGKPETREELEARLMSQPINGRPN